MNDANSGRKEDKITAITSEHLCYLEQHLSVGVWTWDLKLDRLQWSEGFFRILGLNSTQVSPSFELYKSVVHPDDQRNFTSPEALAGDGTLEHRRFRIIRPSGELRWVESHAQLMFEADGRAAQMLGFARDITDTKTAVETRTAFRSLLQALRELTGARIWQTSADGTVLDEMEWWESVDRSHPPGGNWSRLDYVHPEDVAAVREAWASAIETNSVYHSTFRMRQRDGRYERFSSVAVPVKGAQGQTIGWAGASRPSELLPIVRYLDANQVPASLFRAARAFLNLSGETFSEMAGVSYSTIRRLEGGNPDQVGPGVRQQVVDFLAVHGVRFTVDASGTAQLSVVAGAKSED